MPQQRTHEWARRMRAACTLIEKLPDPCRVLDIGCGSVYSMPRHLTKSTGWVGIDAHPIQQGVTPPGRDYPIQFICGDGNTPRPELGKFDCMIGLGVFSRGIDRRAFFDMADIHDVRHIVLGLSMKLIWPTGPCDLWQTSQWLLSGGFEAIEWLSYDPAEPHSIVLLCSRPAS